MGYKVKIVGKGQRTATGANGDYVYEGLDVDYNGQVSEKKLMPGTFKKTPTLKAEYDAIKVGDTVEITTVKEGNYTIITKLAVVNGATQTKGGQGKSYPKKDDDYNTGQQVGNALTNAAATLGGKATVKQLEERAWEIILAGNRLKERLKKGDHLQQTAEPPSIQDDMHDYPEDEDIPF